MTRSSGLRVAVAARGGVRARSARGDVGVSRPQPSPETVARRLRPADAYRASPSRPLEPGDQLARHPRWRSSARGTVPPSVVALSAARLRAGAGALEAGCAGAAAPRRHCRVSQMPCTRRVTRPHSARALTPCAVPSASRGPRARARGGAPGAMTERSRAPCTWRRQDHERTPFASNTARAAVSSPESVEHVVGDAVRERARRSTSHRRRTRSQRADAGRRRRRRAPAAGAVVQSAEGRLNVNATASPSPRSAEHGGARRRPRPTGRARRRGGGALAVADVEANDSDAFETGPVAPPLPGGIRRVSARVRRACAGSGLRLAVEPTRRGGNPRRRSPTEHEARRRSAAARRRHRRLRAIRPLRGARARAESRGRTPSQSMRGRLIPFSRRRRARARAARHASPPKRVHVYATADPAHRAHTQTPGRSAHRRRTAGSPSPLASPPSSCQNLKLQPPRLHRPRLKDTGRRGSPPRVAGRRRGSRFSRL